MNVLKDVVFLNVDCEKGEGPEIAKKFNVRGYPSFAMTNGQGEVTERWIGYEGPAKWAGYVTAGLADTRTIAAKKAAFAADPTKGLACSLANDASTDFDFSAAVKYFRTARDLDPANANEYTGQILTNMYYGARNEAFTLDEVETEAKLVMASPEATAANKVNVAQLVNNLASNNGESERAVPYLTQALAVSEGIEDLAEDRLQLEISHAILVEKDLDKATELKRKSMPEGWQDDPGQLNNFAWWCFEHNHNLAEGEEMALRGVELATSDGDRANILDTAAEICNARGNCDEAIARIKQAIALSPDRTYYQDQLARFEKILQEKKNG